MTASMSSISTNVSHHECDCERERACDPERGHECETQRAKTNMVWSVGPRIDTRSRTFIQTNMEINSGELTHTLVVIRHEDT